VLDVPGDVDGSEEGDAAVSEQVIVHIVSSVGVRSVEMPILATVHETAEAWAGRLNKIRMYENRYEFMRDFGDEADRAIAIAWLRRKAMYRARMARKRRKGWA
jgi:hypothetical protein